MGNLIKRATSFSRKFDFFLDGNTPEMWRRSEDAHLKNNTTPPTFKSLMVAPMNFSEFNDCGKKFVPFFFFFFFSSLSSDYYFCTSGPVMSLIRTGWWKKKFRLNIFVVFGGLFVVVLMLDSTCARQHLDARLCSWSNLDEWLTCAGHPHAVAAREPHKCPSTHNTQHLTHLILFFFFFAGDLIIHLAWIFNGKSFSPFGAGNSKMLKIIVSHDGGNSVISRSNFRISFTWRPFVSFFIFFTPRGGDDDRATDWSLLTTLLLPDRSKKRKKKEKKVAACYEKRMEFQAGRWWKRTLDVRRASNNCGQTFFLFVLAVTVSPAACCVIFRSFISWSLFLSKQHLLSNPITCAHGTHTSFFREK